MQRHAPLLDSASRRPARALRGVACALGLFSLSCEAPTQRGLVLVGVTVLDGSERPLEGALVVIENERITALGPQTHVALPKGLQLVNLAGRYVVPDRPAIVGVEAVAALQARVDEGLSIESVLNDTLRETATGALTAGAPADLRVLSADPRQDLGNLQRVHALVVAGRWIPTS